MQSEKLAKLDEIKVGEIAPTKFGLDLMAETVAEQVRDGNVNALDAVIRLNAMETFVKMVKEKISTDVLDELYKHPKQKAEINGVSVSEMTSIKYEYSHLPGWSELDQQIAELTEKKKAIEDHEKTYHKGDLPIKSSSVTFKIQIPK
ncbi:hypothetical protein UFOVP617_24 [uncultured Caudovirales phage]|uniref:Uncharacterized protein n=1 Tax=uncultured Caudovirales phage TaxID=2100421 RepID=A0A6J5N1Q9_9CAUD|nr:hypothetical protein UFOVP617_24 [uncultured Caudovirales phage]